jgi:mannose-6-phosphate isomerase-like protein (cupin superfamily)
MTNPKPKIAYSKLSDSKWEKKGLRGFLEYRDLGVAAASDGRFAATVGRALHAHRPGQEAPLHYHTIGFHFTYVLKGWMRTYYEGLGEVVLRAGDMVTYEGEIAQAHTEYSEDYEVLQVTMPADFPTVQVEKK